MSKNSHQIFLTSPQAYVELQNPYTGLKVGVSLFNNGSELACLNGEGTPFYWELDCTAPSLDRGPYTYGICRCPDGQYRSQYFCYDCGPGTYSFRGALQCSQCPQGE